MDFEEIVAENLDRVTHDANDGAITIAVASEESRRYHGGRQSIQNENSLASFN